MAFRWWLVVSDPFSTAGRSTRRSMERYSTSRMDGREKSRPLASLENGSKAFETNKNHGETPRKRLKSSCLWPFQAPLPSILSHFQVFLGAFVGLHSESFLRKAAPTLPAPSRLTETLVSFIKKASHTSSGPLLGAGDHVEVYIAEKEEYIYIT